MTPKSHQEDLYNRFWCAILVFMKYRTVHTLHVEKGIVKEVGMPSPENVDEFVGEFCHSVKYWDVFVEFKYDERNGYWKTQAFTYGKRLGGYHLNLAIDENRWHDSALNHLKVLNSELN